MRQPGHGDLEARLEAFEQETGARAGDNDVAVLDLSNQPAGEAEASPGAEAGANEDSAMWPTGRLRAALRA